MKRFKVNDKVIVTRNVLNKNEHEEDFGGDYPTIGVIGKIISETGYHAVQSPNYEYVMEWESNTINSGDLVKDWMIELYNPDWDE